MLISLVSCDSYEQVPVQKINAVELVSDNDSLILNLGRDAKDVSEKHNDIYFGFDLRSSPQEDAAQYIPFLDYLSDTTGYRFKLHFIPKNSSSAIELGNNKIQLAAMGAVSYLIANEKYKAVTLVRGLNELDRAEYQSYFIVRTESPIDNLQQIRGKKLAFGSIDSTQGHLIPRIVMNKNGISLDDLSAYEYTGSHESCAEAVVSGKFDVCALQDKMAKNLFNQGVVKVIHTSEYYPSSGIVASQALEAEKVEKIIKALINFKPNGKHKNLLYNWDKTEMPHGFITAKKSDYSELYKWLIKLKLL